MVSALFTAEVTTIESQIAQLQSQIAQLESRRTTLSECESEADGMLQVVQKTLGKISALAPNAIATLKMALFNLINDGNQGDGKQPVVDNSTPLEVLQTTPQKSPDPLLNGQTCDIDPMCHWEVAAPDGSCCPLASPLCCQLEDAPLLGQACLVASCLEDCPAESLQGQAVEIACPLPQAHISPESMPVTSWNSPAEFTITLQSGETVEAKFKPGCEGPMKMHQFDFTGPISPTGFKSHFAVAAECESDYQTPGDYAEFCVEILASQYQPESTVVKPSPTDTQEHPSLVSQLEPTVTDESALSKAFELVSLTPSVGYMQRISDGEIVCCYVGSNNKQTLKRWGEFLTITHSVGTKFQIREADRLTSWKWELKLWKLSLQQIEKLSACNISKDPRKCFPDAPVRKPERVPTDIELDGYQPGDTVRSVTVRNWTYRILEVRKDGLLECQRINVDAVIKTTLHPGSVELVSKGDAASQSPPEDLEQQAQDAMRYAHALTGIASIEPPAQETNSAPDNIEVDDWVEFLPDGQNYQVISSKDGRLKLLAGDELKYASLSEVKLVFKKPANFRPF